MSGKLSAIKEKFDSLDIHSNSFLWKATLLQFVLTIIAIHKDAELPIEYILLPLFTMGPAIILAALYSWTDPDKKETRSLFWTAFVLPSAISTPLLAILSIGVVFGGPLKEGGIVFIVFPTIFLCLGFLGALIGFSAHHIEKRRTKSSMEA